MRSGDGRFDSMGRSAKFGVYTMFCNTILKVAHFELLQVSGVVRNVQLYFEMGGGWIIFPSKNICQHQIIQELFQCTICLEFLVLLHSALYNFFLAITQPPRRVV